jgi:Rrf2 family protein
MVPDPPTATVTFPPRTAYGLVALLELAGVHRRGGVLQRSEIARRQGIPERYLEEMLASLRRAGLLRSLRGPRGGYQLARPPDGITVAEVVACLEGQGRRERRDDPATPEHSVVAGLEAALERRRAELLARRTLQQLLEERALLQASPVMYFI